MAKAPFIDANQLKHLMKVTAASTESPARNAALLYTIYGTGMMLTEVARLPLSDYLNSNGTIREKSQVSPEISYNGKARPLYWSNAKVTGAIDKYLEYRQEHKHGIATRKAAYRGLDPDSSLFRTNEGEPYKLTQRKTATGAISYSCDSLSQLFRKMHLQAGIEGASAMSGRRTFAIRLFQKGYDLRHINELLGHETLTATKNLIDADPVRLGALVAGVI
jgi:site-specific recombinase XerD